MADFRFDFKVDENSSDVTCNEDLVDAMEMEDDKQNPVLVPAQEHNIVLMPLDMDMIEHVIIRNFSFRKLKRPSLPSPTSSFMQTVTEELLATTDLVSGVYEGGFKLWECALDLILHLDDLSSSPSSSSSTPSIDFTGKRVLEIGCGHGLPGIYALSRGAIVHFQDYNPEVITGVTMPNIVLNVKNYSDRVRLFSGDWGSFHELMSRNPSEFSYDYIITSDTIYNPSYYQKISNIIEHHLNANGTAYIASKSYYFGLNGNTRSFIERFEKQTQGGFLISKVKKIDDGFSNIREILSVIHNVNRNSNSNYS